MLINNPILKGFNPDPSIIRVGSDYYIATSTFEWFPGVQIHHSKDLANWKLVSRPLKRISQLDMKGVPDSCGVWAPCLSYDNGVFYLVYSNVKSFDGVWKDTPNYLVTTTDIMGQWSDPVFLNSRGFDGSLFHDEDGRKWYTSMLVDHRKGKFFGGIILQEFDAMQNKLIGPVHKIFDGTRIGLTEGPHIYKRNGYYYLITAEGGTEYGHAVTLARSKKITGPYEVHPNNPIISSRGNEFHPIQKAGHADLVETAEGDWYAVFLCGRPLTTRGRCTLGRETCIEKMEWKEDGWLYTAHGSRLPSLLLEIPDSGNHLPKPETRDEFNSTELNINFQSLRIPVTEEWLSLTERPGYMRLKGRESLSSFHQQSLVARRVQHFQIEASTCLEFNPSNFQQMAGLVCYYNTGNYYYFYVSGTENGEGKSLNVLSCANYITAEPMEYPIDISSMDKIYLKCIFHNSGLQFFYSSDGNEWIKAGPRLDGSTLSDDFVRDEQNRYRPAFTGSFVGLCCQDLTGNKLHADFDWFEYIEK
ncbi:MAG: glycoside hydrolase family 43 protein [Cytophagaceae bacterium]